MQPLANAEPRNSRTGKVRVRHDPRTKYLGFTSSQWPFLFVLVGNWIFALAFFLGAKLVWHWVPAEWSSPGLVEAVREYSSTLGVQEKGWLTGLRDPKIGRALALMHGDIAAPWSADVLAKEVALSRSASMERFADLVGMPPIRYLTLWRLEIAKRHLLESRLSIRQIAHAVGYESEEGFRRAFRRQFETSPAEWRDRQANT